MAAMLALYLPAGANAALNYGCYACHGVKDFPGGYVSKTRYSGSVHGKFSCAACHVDITAFPHGTPRKVDCGICHLFGKAGAPKTPALQYGLSVHGKAVREGIAGAPLCQTCHGSHYILPPDNPQSRIYRKNIPRLCSRCHQAQYGAYMKSIHAGVLFDMGIEKAAVCSDCHEEHRVPNAASPLWMLWLVSECGNCHKRELTTYRHTYHGKVTRLGYTTVAKCSDCHGAHDILPPSDPNSTLSSSNIVHTCRKCHPGATRDFTKFYAHPNDRDKKHYPRLYYTYLAMTILLTGVFAFFITHTFLWAYRTLKDRHKKKE